MLAWNRSTCPANDSDYLASSAISQPLHHLKQEHVLSGQCAPEHVRLEERIVVQPCPSLHQRPPTTFLHQCSVTCPANTIRPMQGLPCSPPLPTPPHHQAYAGQPYALRHVQVITCRSSRGRAAPPSAAYALYHPPPQRRRGRPHARLGFIS